jgi:hypothetical protein
MKRRAGAPKERAIAPRVKRRAKTAHATLRKGDVLMQAERPPRTVWGAKSRKRKKM